MSRTIGRRVVIGLVLLASLAGCSGGEAVNDFPVAEVPAVVQTPPSTVGPTRRAIDEPLPTATPLSWTIDEGLASAVSVEFQALVGREFAGAWLAPSEGRVYLASTLPADDPILRHLDVPASADFEVVFVEQEYRMLELRRTTRALGEAFAELGLRPSRGVDQARNGVVVTFAEPELARFGAEVTAVEGALLVTFADGTSHRVAIDVPFWVEMSANEETADG